MYTEHYLKMYDKLSKSRLHDKNESIKIAVNNMASKPRHSVLYDRM